VSNLESIRMMISADGATDFIHDIQTWSSNRFHLLFYSARSPPALRHKDNVKYYDHIFHSNQRPDKGYTDYYSERKTS
jgi:hypothetical protein